MLKTTTSPFDDAERKEIEHKRKIHGYENYGKDYTFTEIGEWVCINEEPDDETSIRKMQKDISEILKLLREKL